MGTLQGRGTRDKGKRGEREVIALLQPHVDKACEELGVQRILLQRNTLQAHVGGCDVCGLDWLALEVKRQETLCLAQWWAQTVTQAAPHAEPVLLYRVSRARSWTAMMRGAIGGVHVWHYGPVVVGESMFLEWFDARLRAELKSRML